MQEVEEDGVRFRLCQSQRHPDTVYTISDWGTAESMVTCKMSFYGNLCKHEVKALLMDGFTQTDIVISLGRKFGSAVGGALISSSHPQHQFDLNTVTAEEQLTTEPDFHFPFSFEGDSFYMSHLLIGCKKAVEDVLNMRAQIQNGTWTHVDLSSKSWHERMHEDYRKRPSNQTRPVAERDCAVPFQRTVQAPSVALDNVFDAEALQFVLGGRPDTSKRKKKRKVLFAPVRE
ncbi:hypothetical protein R1sor_000224 [Riccia sorocarpa]|uniref:SWIM-type domain-containing protein n=1 Tax=Riccia sorocarpa TaxID=122646 RepID=A0ABD3GSI2_9MARC